MFLRNLTRLMETRGLNKNSLARESGIPYTTIDGFYKKGYDNTKLSTLEKLAEFFGVSLDFLVNGDASQSLFKFDNLFKIERREFPLLGNIACGTPIFADENFSLYVETGADVQADFCLKAKGDSMIGARINDGDIVFIKQQDMVENGEIAAVLIGDEATLKRVRYDKENNELLLFAENPNYQTLRFIGEELNNIRIIGKAVAFQSDIR